MGEFSKLLNRVKYSHTQGESRWYECEVDNGWQIGEVTNGGISLALAAKATLLHPVLQENGHDVPLTTTARYLRPIKIGKVAFEVNLIRVSRNFTTVQTNIYFNDKLSLYVTLTMGTLSSEDATMHAVSKTAIFPILKPSEFESQAQVGIPGGYETNAWRLIQTPNQLVHGTTADPDKFQAKLRGLSGFKDEEITVLSLVALADALPPPIFNKVGTFGWLPTLEMTVHIRALPPEGISYVGFDSKSKYFGNNLLDEDYQMFTPDGEFLAESRQLSVNILPFPPLTKKQ